MNRFVKIGRNVTVASVVASMGISGCATTSTSGGATNSEGGCNPAAMALLGGILGALASGRNNRGTGAAVGAGVGALACIAWNYNTRQTKTAEEVNNVYKAANNGALPETPKVVTYDINAAPSTIASGSPIVINSKIGIVQGAGGPPPIVEQEIIVGYDGKQVATARKQANQGNQAGEYETSFKVNLPKGVPQGSYPVYTALYVNGSKVESRDTKVQVVWGSANERVALVDEKSR